MHAHVTSHSLDAFSHQRKIQWGKYSMRTLWFFFTTHYCITWVAFPSWPREYNFKLKLNPDPVTLNSKEKILLSFILLRWEAGQWGIDTSRSSVINLQLLVVFPGDVPVMQGASRRLWRAACLLWEVRIYQDPESGSEKAVISCL